MPPTKEQARLGGLKSAETRKKKAELRADLRARLKFEQVAEKMAEVIIDAALGQGDFEKLDPKERAQFALKALEYGVGRPRQTDASGPPPEEKKDEGLHFIIGSPQGELIAQEQPDG